MSALWNAARSALFVLPGETSHRLTLDALAHAPNLVGASLAALGGEVVEAPFECLGIRMRNRAGLAAGLDKDGEALRAWERLGFGFVEVGTVTPRPQPGNPRPRLFRLPGQQALINRMGFNNAGAEALIRNIERAPVSIPVGVNIGKNRDTPTEQAARDYLACLNRVYAHADWITVNISSPNTPGLRALQQAETLETLVAPLLDRREQLAVEHGQRVPLLVKLSPDESEEQLEASAQVLERAGVDGLIATNTTLWRPEGVGDRYGDEAGGFSGSPMYERARAARRRLLASSSLPLIAVGGIDRAERAAEAIADGAVAVQLYSSFIYQGPELVRACARALAG